MRAFVVWALVTLAAFGALGGGYHVLLSDDPSKVLVVVDSSFEMRTAWDRVPSVLHGIGEKRYARFGLATEKSRIHGWRRQPRLDNVVPYGPRDFSRLASDAAIPELADADQVILVTNAPEAETDKLPGWTIVRP